MMRWGRDREKVWGSTGGDQGPGLPVMIGVVLLIIAGVIGLSFLIVALLRAGVIQSPLQTALGLGCLMLLFLGGAIGALIAVARRYAEGSTARRAIVLGGFGVLMGCAPLLMILVVYLLSRGSAP